MYFNYLLLRNTVVDSLFSLTIKLIMISFRSYTDVPLCMTSCTFTAGDAPIHLGRTPLDECTGVELQCAECDPFPSSRFLALEDATYVVVIGPAANPRGYTAITGEYYDHNNIFTLYALLKDTV